MTRSSSSACAAYILNTRGLSRAAILTQDVLSKGEGNKGVTAVAEPCNKLTTWLLAWTKGPGGLARNTQTLVFEGGARGRVIVGYICTNTK